MYKDKNGNMHVPYMGGEIVFRTAGTFTTEDGKDVELQDAIKVSRGAFVSILSFESFAAVVQAAYDYPEVNDFLKKHGVNLKKGLL